MFGFIAMTGGKAANDLHDPGAGEALASRSRGVVEAWRVCGVVAGCLLRLFALWTSLANFFGREDVASLAFRQKGPYLAGVLERSKHSTPDRTHNAHGRSESHFGLYQPLVLRRKHVEKAPSISGVYSGRRPA